MQADYSVALGREDSALELPWQSEDNAVRYYDLKAHPEQVGLISEAAALPELSAFITRVNASTFPLQSAKCDAWFTRELSEDEDVFGAIGKFVSYMDLVFADDEARLSLEKHEELAKKLCELLQRAPEIAAAVELVIRRCYFHGKANSDESSSGFAITVYASGFGDDEPEARKRWSIAVTMLQHALVQVARDKT